MTLREAIYAILEADAQLHTGTELGSLLGHYSAEPYGLYLLSPPKTPSLPLVTYFFSAQGERKPRELYLNITAWGDNYEAIQERIYVLLNDTQVAATDFSVKMLKWDWAGPELFDDDLKCYYQQHRYLCKAWKL